MDMDNMAPMRIRGTWTPDPEKYWKKKEKEPEKPQEPEELKKEPEEMMKELKKVLLTTTAELVQKIEEGQEELELCAELDMLKKRKAMR